MPMTLPDLEKRYKSVIRKWGLASLSVTSVSNNLTICFGTPDNIHREDGPAVIAYHGNGRLQSHRYLQNGVYHRINGPADIQYMDDGRLQFRAYCLNGLYHRENGPAVCEYKFERKALECKHYITNQLHRETGPAVYWVYKQPCPITGKMRKKTVVGGWYWHGVRVDEDVILHPEKDTVDKILFEPNMEVRRVRIERYGWLRFLKEIHAEILDERTDDVSGTKEILVQPRERTFPAKHLICSCPSTGRVYAVEVPFHINKCDDAQLWLKGPALRQMQIIGAS